MILVDLNLLLYAVNRHAANHHTIRQWWEQMLASDEPVGLAWSVLVGFLRLATNPHVFSRPLTPEEAIDRADAWLGHPQVRLACETAEHWTILRQLLREAGTAGNLTSDAHLAALAISLGATLATCDHDFARFPRLRRYNPLTEVSS